MLEAGQGMNCPRCGRVAYPRFRACICGERLAWPSPPVAGNKPLPTPLAQRLTALGFEQRNDETPHQFAERCRQYILARCTHSRDDCAA